VGRYDYRYDHAQNPITRRKLILKLLSPMHVWTIAQRIRQMSGEILQVGQSALYPSLHKLEQNGWIHSSLSPQNGK
jgi:DNA-binding PadR family transcriptional regulator